MLIETSSSCVILQEVTSGVSLSASLVYGVVADSSTVAALRDLELKA